MSHFATNSQNNVEYVLLYRGYPCSGISSIMVINFIQSAGIGSIKDQWHINYYLGIHLKDDYSYQQMHWVSWERNNIGGEIRLSVCNRQINRCSHACTSPDCNSGKAWNILLLHVHKKNIVRRIPRQHGKLRFSMDQMP